MKINPILKRDMTVASRSTRLAGLIMAANALVLGVDLLGIFGVMSRYKLEEKIDYRMMLNVYFAAGMLIFFLVLFLYPALTVGSISGERMSGTMDLMKASGMSPVRIVFGKYAAGALPALVLLASFLPGLVLPLLFGGVRITSCLILLLLLVPTALFFLAAGLFAGSWTAHSGTAVLLSLGITLGVTFLPFLVAALLRQFVPEGRNFAAWLCVLSPLTPLGAELLSQIGREEIISLIADWLKAGEGYGEKQVLVTAGIIAQCLMTVFSLVSASVSAGGDRKVRKSGRL